MNRRTKIIVSVAGIFIIALALLGLTYAYFLTKINGNTNDKSISVTTANLRLDYGEETSDIVSKSNVQPGEAIITKTFTATNNGTNEVEYAVVFENIVNTFTRKEDVVYTLECTSSSGTSCNGVTEETTFPSGESAIIIGNKIAKDVTHNYTLTVIYKEMDVDQSVDMNKTISAKVNIADPNKLNPYVANKKLLAYNIINNAAINKNGTELRATPLTIPAQETSEKYNEVGSVATSPTSFSVSTTYQGYYWTYGTGYEIDPYTGKFTLIGVQTCKYNEGSCASKIRGNYVVASSASGNANSANTAKTTTNLSNVYKVDEAPAASTTASISMKVKRVSSVKESAESTMSFAADDYGTSYYYRGDVEDNYLELNNMCFRIVRIQGDGSIKVTLANNGPCSGSTTSSGLVKDAAGTSNKSAVYGYTTTTVDSKIICNFNYEGYTGGLYTTLNDWYNAKLVSVQDKLKNETWCLGGKTSRYDYKTGALMSDTDVANQLTSLGYNRYNYETGNRLYDPYIDSTHYDHTTRNASYRCSSEADKVTNYVGTLLADEVVYAGGALFDSTVSNQNGNKTYYLNDNANNSYYWLLSRMRFNYDRDYAFLVDFDGYVRDYNVDISQMVRPAVTIATGAELLSGDGTIGSPYTIKMDQI